MAIVSMFSGFLDKMFNPSLLPLLNWSPFWGIVIISLLISLIITLLYKFVTNQELMKDLKGKQKEFQKRMKELRSNPEEMMKVQKEAMKVNADYMKQSFKPTLITIIPIFLIFGWLAAHLTYEPIYPGETYSVSAEFMNGVKEAELIVTEGSKLISEPLLEVQEGGVTWLLQSSAGEHFLTVKAGNDEQTKKVLITKELKYEEASLQIENSPIISINIDYKTLKPLGEEFSLFGWKPGWLGLYIIFSMIFSIGLRKVLKLY